MTEVQYLFLSGTLFYNVSVNKRLSLFAVLSPYAFSICDTTGPEYEVYQYGGIARQVKASSSLVAFVS